MSEPLKKQGYDSITGKDRIGQDLEDRSSSSLAPKASCRVDGPVLRTSKNFHRATIKVDPDGIGQTKRDQELVDEDGNGEKEILDKAAMKDGIDSTAADKEHKEPRANTTKSDMAMDHLKE